MRINHIHSIAKGYPTAMGYIFSLMDTSILTSWLLKKKKNELSMMTHTFDASAWETEADSEFQANISLK